MAWSQRPSRHTAVPLPANERPCVWTKLSAQSPQSGFSDRTTPLAAEGPTSSVPEGAGVWVSGEHNRMLKKNVGREFHAPVKTHRRFLFKTLSKRFRNTKLWSARPRLTALLFVGPVSFSFPLIPRESGRSWQFEMGQRQGSEQPRGGGSPAIAVVVRSRMPSTWLPFIREGSAPTSQPG